MVVVEAAFWVAAGLLVWTHLVYPAVAAALARVAGRPVRSAVLRPRRRLRVRPAEDRRRRRAQQGRRLLAIRAERAQGRVAALVGHRRKRLDLRRAALGLRRGRPTVRPRLVAPVPHGAET